MLNVFHCDAEISRSINKQKLFIYLFTETNLYIYNDILRI